MFSLLAVVTITRKKSGHVAANNYYDTCKHHFSLITLTFNIKQKAATVSLQSEAQFFCPVYGMFLGELVKLQY